MARTMAGRWLTASIVVMAMVAMLAPASAASRSYLPGPQDTYRVFVIGDSLAGGLWAGLARQAHDDPSLKVNGRFKEGSGLARPDIYDWPMALKGILERNQFDIAIIMLGANDGRDIHQAGELITYGSPQWVDAYNADITALIDILKQAKVAVYWVGLPPMASSSVDEVAKRVSGLERTAVEKAGFKFIDIRAQFANADGSYTESGYDLGNNLTRLRSHNGVNFLRSGNDKLASIVLDQLHADMDAAQGIAPQADTAQNDNQQTPSRRQRPGIDLPVFGKALVNGDLVQINPDDLPSPDAVAVARLALPAEPQKPKHKAPALTKPPLDDAEKLAVLNLTGPPGSQANKLFTRGEAPTPEPGRIDDFSVSR